MCVWGGSGGCEGSPSKRPLTPDPRSKLFLSYGEHSNCVLFCFPVPSTQFSVALCSSSKSPPLCQLLPHLALWIPSSKTRFIIMNPVPTCVLHACTRRARSFPLTPPPPQEKRVPLYLQSPLLCCGQDPRMSLLASYPAATMAPSLRMINMSDSLLFQENVFPQPCLWSNPPHP